MGDRSQTRRRSGSKRQERKRRQQREANIARAIKQKGHVQEGALSVSVCICVSCVNVFICLLGFVRVCVCIASCVNSRLAGFKQSELTEVCGMD